MIPTQIKGKSAEEIFYTFRNSVQHETYVNALETFLKLAISNALLNADQTYEHIQVGEYRAEQRAIEFLNLLVPIGRGGA